MKSIYLGIPLTLAVNLVLIAILLLPAGVAADTTTWSLMHDFVQGGDQGIWGASSSNIYVVGEWGKIYQYNGLNWSTIYNPMSGRLLGIYGTSSDNVYAVGWRGFEDVVLHYDGAKWSDMYNKEMETTTLEDVWVSQYNKVYVVGGGSDARILKYDDGDWYLDTFLEGQWCKLHGVWGSSDSDVFAVGRHQAILHYNGSNWSQMGSTVMHQHLYDVWGSSSSDVFAVGWGGKILHYNGSTWHLFDDAVGIPGLQVRSGYLNGYIIAACADDNINVTTVIRGIRY